MKAAFAEGLFPSSCPICASASDSLAVAPICAACWQAMTPYAGPSCGICAQPLVSALATSCADCLTDSPRFTKAFSFGLYEGTLKEAINLYKFSKLRRLSEPLGELFSGLPLPPVDALAAVPLTKKGILERGFNQSLLLGKPLSRRLGVPLLPHALRKERQTSPQATLARKQRLKNLKGAFWADSAGVSGKTILLLDDVMTTGATARECSKALVKAGAKEVFVATLARAGM